MGDYIRWATPYHEGAEDSAKSALFLALNRGKRSIRLNLKEERGREVLLRLVREHDVLLESFRPGRDGPARRGLRAPARGEPGARVLRDHGLRAGRSLHGALRARHELPRPGRAARASRGERGGPPVQAAGQIADIGRRRADGGLRHPGRAARARALRAGAARGRVDVRRRAVLARAGGRPLPLRAAWCRSAARSSWRAALICYRPYACKDGWVTLGALEPKFWQAWCAGVGREDLVEKQFEAPGSDAHAEVERIFLERTREEWREFASNHDCCLEPVLDLDETLDSELVRAREMVVELDQPGADGRAPARACRSSSRARRARRPDPGPALGEHTRDVLSTLGYDEERDRRAGGGGGGGRTRGHRRPRELHGVRRRTGS